MISRLFLMAVGLVATLALGACGGGSSPSVSARDESPTTTSTSSTTTTAAAASTVPPASSAPSSTVSSTPSGFRSVEYRGLRFQVPDGWPVYDLAKDPTRCVRFDEHAVYLGHAGANQDCPAHVVGRTEAVQVEPIDETARTTEARATTPDVVNGVQVREDPSSGVTHSIVAAFDGQGGRREPDVRERRRDR
jgi:hypothetical protein